MCLGIVESNGDIDDDDGERDDDGAEENGKDERRRTTGGWTRTVARARGTREERRKGAQSEAKRNETPEVPEDILEVYHEKIGGNEDASERIRRETKSGLEWNGTDGMVYD